MTPASFPSNNFVDSLSWKGAWSSSTVYSKNDAVSYQGGSWICLVANSNQTPQAGTYWAQVAAKGDTGSTGATGSTGPQGSSGVIAVTAPITNSGTSTNAQIGVSVGTTSGTVAAGDDSRITGAAQKASNLSDLPSASTARSNLGLGDSSTKNVGTSAGTVAAGNDSRLSDARTPTSHKASHATGGSDALSPSDIGAVASSSVGAANGVAPLDGTSKISSSYLPAVAISDTFVVSSQAAMLALTAEVGDIAVRTDVSKSYILTTTPASTLANWQELLTPPDTVQSVAGKTGIVTLAKADVGLGNVDNTSDASKPVSTATQTALDGKSNTTHTHAVTGDATGTLGNGSTAITLANTSTARTNLGLGNVDNTSDTDKFGNFKSLNIPLVNGIGSAGTGSYFSLDDHVHPTDTTRAPLASPAFTGTPTAPTAGINNNSTTIATTAYVVGQAASAAQVPLVNGTAAVGTSLRFARSDHVHPTDTTRADTSLSNVTPATGRNALGLSNVDNTSDANKPVSTATQTALDAKVATASAGITSVTVSSTNKLIDAAANWDTQFGIGSGLQTLPRHSSVQTLSPASGTSYVMRCIATKSFTTTFASVACLASGNASSVKVAIWTDSSSSPATGGPAGTSSAISLTANTICNGNLAYTVTAGQTYYIGLGVNWTTTQPTFAGSSLNAQIAAISPALIYTGSFTTGSFGTGALSSGGSGLAPFIYLW